jgi:hypothetical protein
MRRQCCSKKPSPANNEMSHQQQVTADSAKGFQAWQADFLQVLLSPMT